ncbi:MAG: N-formylglutamate amidohydrolase [Gammaproteobacteria bacterium]|nr:MAG: N-formylglutamate amidohydrolase [Gammaproteobacteria bacterium]
MQLTVLNKLMNDDDLPAVTVFNRKGKSGFVITCEHAGNAIPASLGTLGLGDADLSRHIAWDIGAATTAQRIAESLDSPLVLQRYSRLVIDCNRPPEAPDAIPPVSDGTMIPGNQKISVAEHAARYEAIHRPFHQAVEALLAERTGRDCHSALIAFHTFTPALDDNPAPRPWDMGLLYNRDARLAERVDRALDGISHGYEVAHNQPYSVCDETDYTLPVHGESRGIYNLLLEVRNDHLRNETDVAGWSLFLSTVLKKVEQHL